MTAGPEQWALDAASLPLAFAQVREDPRLDMEVAAALPPGAKVMMIASGGETAVCLARLPLARLVLVDVNPAQLSLTRCRLHLAAVHDAEQSMALLGHKPMLPAERGAAWEGILRKLGLARDGLAPPVLLASHGADHCGRYEAAFARLRRLLAPVSDSIGAFLRSTDPAAASRIIAPDSPVGAALDAAFSSALRLENLVALFGEGATQNPLQPFDRHFATQLRDITSRQAPAVNPWLWQLLAGTYPPQSPVDWLRNAAAVQAQPEFLCGTMLDALQTAPRASMDFVHLSNILDWLTPADAAATLAAADRVLRPGGKLLIRQLNSSLNIPALYPGLQWDHDAGQRMQQADRSFFYLKIHLASRA